MGNGNELIEVALTVVIALAVGLTSASFDEESQVAEPGGATTQMHGLVCKVMQALSPIGQPVADDSSLRRLEL
jgi:hypothetical protein